LNQYRGRFAPTPTGPLHFGSLFAAVVSYLDAKANNGHWLVRIEDIDPPREQPGASSDILRTLEAYGFEWDGDITYQSNNSERYLANLEKLSNQGNVFWCDCSRKKLKDMPVYPGYCRHKLSKRSDHAIRLNTQHSQIDAFLDQFQGEQAADISLTYGDVILQRRDGLFAYQLAVVSDDIDQGISHIIRGIDLLSSTFWQRELTRKLGHDQKMPIYGHFPVIHERGSNQKLSKQNRAAPVENRKAISTLNQVFKLLNIECESEQPRIMLAKAVPQWQPSRLQSKLTLQVD